ncbi:MAG: hypothetical protein JG777_2856 [Clostridia bacterium]|nr:hypothetical protein [Clostridia bacterium]
MEIISMNAFAAPKSGSVATIENGVQIVKTIVTANRYLPDTIVLQKGVPVRWIILVTKILKPSMMKAQEKEF